jgi:hypothetical protein
MTLTVTVLVDDKSAVARAEFDLSNGIEPYVIDAMQPPGGTEDHPFVVVNNYWPENAVPCDSWAAARDVFLECVTDELNERYGRD